MDKPSIVQLADGAALFFDYDWPEWRVAYYPVLPYDRANKARGYARSRDLDWAIAKAMGDGAPVERTHEIVEYLTQTGKLDHYSSQTDDIPY